MSSFQDFTRGGQIILHAFRMLMQVSKHLFRILVFFVVLFNCIWFFMKTTEIERYVIVKWAYASVLLDASLPEHTISFTEPSGKVVESNAKEIASSRKINELVKSTKAKTLSGFFTSLFCCLGIIVMTILFFMRSGIKRRSSKFKRGSKELPPAKLSRLLKRYKACSDFSFANVPLVKDTETKHILITGSSGTGKTVAINELLDQIRAKKQRVIIYDKMGSFVSKYFREGKDILLNPLDARCANWNIWAEGANRVTYNMLAKALIPSPPPNADKTWVDSARILFTSVASKLHEHHNPTTARLIQHLLYTDAASLAQFVKGTAAESIITEKAEKFTQSVIGTLAPAIYPLECLQEQEDDKPLFSIRDWIKQDDDSWLFISSRSDQHATIISLISTWLEIATNSLLSLPPDPNRRIWTVIDELPSLYKLPSLFSALAESRQFGGCSVLSFQSISQLRDIYGADGAETISGLCSTRLIFRNPELRTAEWLSKSLGQIEVDETKEGLSYGAHEIRDGVSIQSHTSVKPLVLYPEIMELEDLAAYLRLPGKWPITKVQFQYKDRPVIADAWVEKTSTPPLSKSPTEVKPAVSRPTNLDTSLAIPLKQKEFERE